VVPFRMLHDQTGRVEEVLDAVEVVLEDLVELRRRDLRVEIG